MIGKIIFPNIAGRAIVQRANDIYIVPALGYYKNQEVYFNLEEAKRMPSLLFAVEELHEYKLEESVKFIKENF